MTLEEINTKIITLDGTPYQADLNKVRAKDIRAWTKRLNNAMGMKIQGNDMDIDLNETVNVSMDIELEIGNKIFGLPDDADLSVEQYDVMSQVVVASGFMRRLQDAMSKFSS